MGKKNYNTIVLGFLVGMIVFGFIGFIMIKNFILLNGLAPKSPVNIGIEGTEEDVCDDVCDIDPSCCSGNWDDFCQQLQNELCNDVIPCTSDSDCSEALPECPNAPVPGGNFCYNPCADSTCGYINPPGPGSGAPGDTCITETGETCGDLNDAACAGCICQAGLTRCSATVCADIQNDENHCGPGCIICGLNNVCNNGVCECDADNGFVQCDEWPVCENTNSDINNCGTCGKKCKDGEKCQNGECFPLVVSPKKEVI